MIEYFNKMKADLVETYKADLCEESVEAINNASDIAEFVRLLPKFSVYLNYKELPSIDWVKKWFNTTELRRIANDNGVYFDGIATIVSPIIPIVLMGDVKAIFTCAHPHLYQIVTQDESSVQISTFCNCVVRVRQKNNSEVSVLHTHNLSRIKITKV
jgi:hypothetical protein